MEMIDLTEWSNWVDAQDVLQKLHICPRTLQRWRINGLLPYSRVSGKCYYKKSDILALLEKCYNGD
ncbi:helix-turn-helix domain-containing protein [Proteiniphilum saccharofermentans]|uniref:helix-turn-helix domain-containing protein n=1 Tax=Proteiniphilum saccharofermentans TaxID=1642647 RepID=UPI0028AD7258|nr:helix-turn-helix domain-containing protein [Proteiniphilum saccharofermentans]